jgi:hypothetical protein
MLLPGSSLGTPCLLCFLSKVLFQLLADFILPFVQSLACSGSVASNALVGCDLNGPNSFRPHLVSPVHAHMCDGGGGVSLFTMRGLLDNLAWITLAGHSQALSCACYGWAAVFSNAQHIDNQIE